MGTSDAINYEKERDILNRKLILMGKDVGEIPCFRNSFLYGITSGMVAGITFFAFTSKLRRATSFGFWSYIGVTTVYWFQCRYRYSVLKFEHEQISFAMQQQAMYGGTELDILKQLDTQTGQPESSSPASSNN